MKGVGEIISPYLLYQYGDLTMHLFQNNPILTAMSQLDFLLDFSMIHWKIQKSWNFCSSWFSKKYSIFTSYGIFE